MRWSYPDRLYLQLPAWRLEAVLNTLTETISDNVRGCLQGCRSRSSVNQGTFGVVVSCEGVVRLQHFRKSCNGDKQWQRIEAMTSAAKEAAEKVEKAHSSRAKARSE